MHTIAGEVGYGTGEGLRVEASWQHRNFFPPEGTVTLRGVLGQQEQSITATLRRANFGRRDRVLNLELTAANLDQPAYQAKIAGIGASLERQTNLIFQKDWAWSLGAELRVSDERDFYGTDLVPRRRTYLVAALPTGINYDDSDDLLDPRKGFRLGARVSPEVSLQGSVFSYIRMQFDGSYYLQASERVTIAGRARLGTIVGASRDRIAPTRRFYAGGGGSVRGYSYQAIGPRDANNAPIGGRSLGELSLEARFRFGSENQFGVVPFIDAGTISSQPWPSIKEMRVGAGLGFRYYSNFGPIRIDVGTPLNPQPGDPRIGVYVSLDRPSDGRGRDHRPGDATAAREAQAPLVAPQLCLSRIPAAARRAGGRRVALDRQPGRPSLRAQPADRLPAALGPAHHGRVDRRQLVQACLAARCALL